MTVSIKGQEIISRDSAFVNEKDPFSIFNQWFEDAQISELNDPNAMAVATVDDAGMPNLRTVLLKGHSSQGFVFYTNFEGTKGREILTHPKVALLFHWKTRRRQVRIRGNVEQVSAPEADAYFNSRHPQSRLGSWASNQSKPLKSREELLEKLKEFEAKYGTQNIPRPPHWSGFRVVPEQIEFWQDGDFRLHDRVLFTRVDRGWESQRLNP